MPSAPKAILRTDYRPTPYLITDVHLTFLLGDTTRVKSKLSCVPNYQGSPPSMALDGELSKRCCASNLLRLWLSNSATEAVVPWGCAQRVQCCK